MVAGAVYRPVEDRLPTLELIDHVTAMFVVPETKALNWACPDAERTAEVGEMETAICADTTGIKARSARSNPQPFQGSTRGTERALAGVYSEPAWRPRRSLVNL
jgi:hypothetical protein